MGIPAAFALYLKALTHGLFRGPEVDPSLRAELQERWTIEGGPALFAELAQVDPPSALRLHPNDKKRVLRALEVQSQSGRALSDWQREWRDGAGRSPQCRTTLPATWARAGRSTGQRGPSSSRGSGRT